MTQLFDKTVEGLSHSLDLHLLRHSVIMDNIANAETPYYKSRRVDFEKALEQAVQAQEDGMPGGNIGQVEPHIYQDPDAEVGQDLNSVDMDREMAQLTKNEVKYNAITQAAKYKFSVLKFAISEGK